VGRHTTDWRAPIRARMRETGETFREAWAAMRALGPRPPAPRRARTAGMSGRGKGRRQSIAELDAWTRGKRLFGAAECRKVVEDVTIPKWGLTLEEFAEAYRAGDLRLLGNGVASDCAALVRFCYPPDPAREPAAAAGRRTR
jgi:hypothetical protein